MTNQNLSIKPVNEDVLNYCLERYEEKKNHLAIDRIDVCARPIFQIFDDHSDQCFYDGCFVD